MGDFEAKQAAPDAPVENRYLLAICLVAGDHMNERVGFRGVEEYLRRRTWLESKALDVQALGRVVKLFPSVTGLVTEAHARPADEVIHYDIYDSRTEDING